MVKQSDAAAWNSLAPAGRDLDLRQTARDRRHPTVFYAFDGLTVGESFFIVNDHNPLPLRGQLEQLRPGEAAWETVIDGPDQFRIKVSRIAARVTPAEETVLAGRGA
jgi:uncharacterized protein (DUF2249 family)